MVFFTHGPLLLSRDWKIVLVAWIPKNLEIDKSQHFLPCWWIVRGRSQSEGEKNDKDTWADDKKSLRSWWIFWFRIHFEKGTIKMSSSLTLQTAHSWQIPHRVHFHHSRQIVWNNDIDLTLYFFGIQIFFQIPFPPSSFRSKLSGGHRIGWYENTRFPRLPVLLFIDSLSSKVW